MLTLESTTQTQQLKCCYVDTLKDMSDTVRLKWKQRIRNTAQFPQWWFSSGFTARGCALMFLQRLIESTTSESIELQKFKESFLQQCFVCVKWRRDSGGWNIIQILHRFFFLYFLISLSVWMVQQAEPCYKHTFPHYRNMCPDLFSKNLSFIFLMHLILWVSLFS